jgi:hypothetical protein
MVIQFDLMVHTKTIGLEATVTTTESPRPSRRPIYPVDDLEAASTSQASVTQSKKSSLVNSTKLDLSIT